MKKQFGKPLNLKGLEDGKLDKFSIAEIAISENGKNNVESGHLENIRELANEAYMNSEYFHSEKHIASLKKGGVASSIVNKEKGNIGGGESNMVKYKMAKKAKERALMLMNLPNEFTPKEATKIFTSKQWFNIKKTNLVIKTEKRSGYNNKTPHYILNNEAIKLAIDTSDNPSDYFK